VERGPFAEVAIFPKQNGRFSVDLLTAGGDFWFRRIPDRLPGFRLFPDSLCCGDSWSTLLINGTPFISRILGGKKERGEEVLKQHRFPSRWYIRKQGGKNFILSLCFSLYHLSLKKRNMGEYERKECAAGPC